MADKWLNVGSLRKSQKGEFYIKINENVSLNKGDVIQVQDPRKKLKDSVTAGRLSEEKAAEYAAKIPEYVRYDLVLPPPKTS